MGSDLSFEWDEANVEHVGRHGISPDEVFAVFANEAIDLSYEAVGGEDRWTSIGHTDGLRILVIVWTIRGESIRPVTAFDPGKRLAAEYYRQKGW